MITWMQRHKKWLIITIWISTIAFIGAGFVGWGQYSYGDKAGAVAKVGSVEISRGELEKSYSNLYAQYNKMFQGSFDEEKAKSFGLQAQALQQLINQALIINLAKSYNLKISDKEMVAELETQTYFFKNGVFNKDLYKQILSSNHLSVPEYEKSLRKDLLIQKTLKLLPRATNENEKNIFNTLLSIADKINYKVLDAKNIKVSLKNSDIKKFWETQKQNFKTDKSYNIEFIKQTDLSKKYSDNEVKKYYEKNRTHFKAKDGKILSLKDARTKVVDELNIKATKDTALRTYIAFKKGKYTKGVDNITISNTNNPFNQDVLSKVSKASTLKPYMKPIKIKNGFLIVKLVKIENSKIKSFKDAKKDLLPIYINTKKAQELVKLANNSVKSFKGITSDFITRETISLKKLSKPETQEFLGKLFLVENKQGYVKLNNGKVVLFEILEQKMLKSKKVNQGALVAKLKNNMFNEGLIKDLKNKYKTEIFIKGL